MQRNAPSEPSRGFGKKSTSRSSNQKTIDRLGVAFLPDYFDVAPHAAAISTLEERIAYLAERLVNNPAGKTERLVIKTDTIALQLVTNLGFTQCNFAYLPGSQPQVAHAAFGMQSGSVDAFELSNVASLAQCHGVQEITWRGKVVPKQSLRMYETYPILDKAFYETLARVFRETMEMSQGLRSAGNTSFALALYESGADIAKSQRVEHHIDRVEGTDTVSTAIALSGKVTGRVGTDPAKLESLDRNPGDALSMNYLAVDFPVRAPIHDMTNTGVGRALNLVIDERGIDGLAFLNSIGVFSLVQRDLIHACGIEPPSRFLMEGQS